METTNMWKEQSYFFIISNCNKFFYYESETNIIIMSQVNKPCAVGHCRLVELLASSFTGGAKGWRFEPRQLWLFVSTTTLTSICSSKNVWIVKQIGKNCGVKCMMTEIQTIEGGWKVVSSLEWTTLKKYYCEYF